MKTATQYTNYLETLIGEDQPEEPEKAAKEATNEIVAHFRSHIDLTTEGYLKDDVPGVEVFVILFKDKSIAAVFNKEYRPISFDLDDPEDAMRVNVLLDNITEGLSHENS